jgi:hypothetical protein
MATAPTTLKQSFQRSEPQVAKPVGRQAGNATGANLINTDQLFQMAALISCSQHWYDFIAIKRRRVS